MENDEYFDFLYDMGFKDNMHRSLARYLHDTAFIWSLERDENRMYDGLAMRREFDDKVYGQRFDFKLDHSKNFDIYSKLYDNTCTNLEFFVGFAHRLVREMFEMGDISVPELVHRMLDNLDIWVYDDDNDFQDDYVIDDINDKLDIWRDRRYYETGSHGNIFTVFDPPKPLQYVEMWVQASWWYNENFT